MVGDSPDIVGEGPISDLGDLKGWRDNHSIVIWSFALFGCFILNVTLLLAFLIRPSLRTLSNRFVMNLTVSNLLVCAIMNPLTIMDTLSSEVPIVEPPSIGSICAISEGAMAIVTTSSVLSVLLIAVDQYFAVVDPLRYRARVDKLKSGILIMSVWLISILFGFVAFFNPNPRSFWLPCTSRHKIWTSNVIALNSSMERAIDTLRNSSGELNDTSRITTIMETMGNGKLHDNVDLLENRTVILNTLTNGTVTYGFVYAIVYTIFAFLVPFAAVCWIYVSIYVAAHRNSERARRSGSKPILSSASFTEEQMGPSRLQRLQTDTVEDFRKLPKISSLSSIDETSETMQPTGQVSRRRSFSSAMDVDVTSSSPVVENKTSGGIVFTVGLERLEISPQSTDESNEPEQSNLEDNEGNISERQDSSLERIEKSSEREFEANGWTAGRIVDESSESEDETRFEDAYNTSMEFPSVKRLSTCLDDYSSSFLGNQLTAIKTIETIQRQSTGGQVDENETGRMDEVGKSNDQSEGRLLRRVDIDETTKQGTSQADSRILRNPSEVKFNRRLSIFTSNKEVPTSVGETGKLSNSCNKTEKDSSMCLLTPIVTITPAPSKNENLHRVSSVRSTSSYINSLKDRISNGSIFRHREEARAARISALVIVMGLICWSPYVILLVMKNLPRSTDQYLPHKYDMLASSLLILAAYVSPLLFGYRSKRVKRELRRFFCFKKELSYKNNRSLMAKKVLKRRHSSTLSNIETDRKYNIFNCVYGRSRWPKENAQFVQVPDTALAVETCRSSFSSGASTQISTTSTEEC